MITIAFDIVATVLNLLVYVLIVWVLLSNLIAFGIVDRRNSLTRSLEDFLDSVTRPVLRPIQRLLPRFGGVDLSPLVAILLIQIVLQPLLGRLKFAILTGDLSTLLL